MFEKPTQGALGAHERESEYAAEAAASWDLGSSSRAAQVVHTHLLRFP